MSKPRVDEQEYARLISEKMREHSEYKEGMRVEVTPEGSGRPSGLHAFGGSDVNGIFAWAQSKIDDEYVLTVTR